MIIFLIKVIIKTRKKFNMIIKNYKKLKNNEYELTLDNGTSIFLYEETIIKYNLLINKNINQKELELILKDNDNYYAYYAALNYLNKKMRTEYEIKKYLENKDYETVVINDTINILKKQGYLNNDQYIELYINDQYHLTNNGPEKIKYNLIKLGIDETKINIDKDFDHKIKKIITKKVKLNTKLSTKSLILNISNYLINLGYHPEMFQPYLENITTNDDKFIKKEYQKLYNQNKNKYDQNKLIFILKDKLYKKGYDLDLINKTIEKEIK